MYLYLNRHAVLSDTEYRSLTFTESSLDHWFGVMVEIESIFLFYAGIRRHNIFGMQKICRPQQNRAEFV